MIWKCLCHIVTGFGKSVSLVPFVCPLSCPNILVIEWKHLNALSTMYFCFIKLLTSTAYLWHDQFLIFFHMYIKNSSREICVFKIMVIFIFSSHDRRWMSDNGHISQCLVRTLASNWNYLSGIVFRNMRLWCVSIIGILSSTGECPLSKSEMKGSIVN